MNANELPLQQLFTKLREAGLPLGIDEYQLLLRSLQGGFGISDKAALKRLCQTLWVKSAEEKAVLEYYFDRVMGSEDVVSFLEKPPIYATSDAALKKPRKRKISPIFLYVVLAILGVGIVLGLRLWSQQQTLKQTNIQTNLIFWSFLTITALGGGYVLFWWITKGKGEFTPSSPASSQPLKLKRTREDKVQVVKSVLQATATSRHERIPDTRFILTREFFPVTQRQMKQVWRYLRRPLREGKATELDVEATINQIGQQGLLLEIVLVPPRVNRTELMLLIDQDGSMVPFHALSRRLAETALGGGRLGRTGIYYFHNSPVEYLYRDRYHQQGELVRDILTHRCSERTAVLIFSDGGAARGGSSKERYKLTQEFLTQLQQRVRHIAWLNPIPRKRWLGTTAAEIARLVPMFEVSRPGLQDAISVLRGRPTNFEGWKK